jgi:ubiquinone/menaquinone biosynthesis C-methylase UbiE
MDDLSDLKEVLKVNCSVRLVEDGIYSILPASSKHRYDRRATAYDLVVGTRLYNSVMWGSSPSEYSYFARKAVTSCPNGKLLDAACGSMLFTGSVYVGCNRKIIAFDQSLSMLRRARKRLIKLSGSQPRHILLLQADLLDLPFRPASFCTVLCMNVLHHLENGEASVQGLKWIACRRRTFIPDKPCIE